MRRALLALACVCAFPALADQPPVDQYPPFLKPFVPQRDKPMGQSKLEWTWLDIYDIALWTGAEKWSYTEPFALHVRYAKGFSGPDLVESTIKEMNATGDFTPQEEDNARAELLVVLPDVKSGDTITAVHVPGQFLTMYHNDTMTGRITDRVLAKRFFDIWLGPKTTHPKMASALKGESSE